ncbi:glycosyltransferase family 4 protein [Priestia megaterium]|uniref:glycosyltransferase family 4 protein n=1 Tax=Priestia megaterium TaxID=1404 RepID=UPI0013632983|nr:glycosyltransferase family 4 protein [Priestia megaterium]
MKLLVIQEQHFTRLPNGEVWVDEQSNAKFWDRYLNVFEEIIVCARFSHKKSNNIDKLMRSDRDRVSFIELPNFRGVSGLLKNLTAVIGTIKSAIKQSDSVIFRAPSPISMIAYPLVKASKKPYAVEVMNNPKTVFSKESMRNFYQPIITSLMVNQTKSMCMSANGVSYVTNKVLQELYPSKASKQGENEAYFESSYSTIHLEETHYSYSNWGEMMPSPIKLIHTGKMQDNRKGQDIFIEVIFNLRNKGFNVEGILVGDGVMRQEFENIGRKLGISEYLEFVGWKAGYKAVQEELQKSHIIVFPTMGEGLPRSVIEAMANGLLCIGSKVDGICELLEEDCLVPEFNSECFTRYIENFLRNWNLVEDMRRNQFGVSKSYEYSILESRRNVFYSKLKNLC